MIDSKDLVIKDGDYEVIYSGDFNIYENRLTIGPIYGFEFELIFEEDKTKSDSPVHFEVKEKTILIKLINFNNPLGVGSVAKGKVLKWGSQNIYISIHAKSLNPETSFIKASVTFYKK